MSVLKDELREVIFYGSAQFKLHQKNHPCPNQADAVPIRLHPLFFS